MANIPKAPKEGSSSESEDAKAMWFLTEENQAAATLHATLIAAADRVDRDATTQSQRLAALAVGGRAPSGGALLDGPVPIGGIYQATPASVDDNDVVTLLLDIKGRAIVVGPAAEDAAVLGSPVLVGGRYDATPRDLDDGDVGAVALDADANVIVVGNAAEDAAVVGAPVQIGGRYDATDRTLDDGDVGAIALDIRARQQVVPPLADSTTALAAKTVGNTTTEILAAEANRVTATFINDSDETMYLAIGVDAVMNRGIRLNANGGSYEINWTNLDTREVDAICTSGGKNLCVLETHRA